MMREVPLASASQVTGIHAGRSEVFSGPARSNRSGRFCLVVKVDGPELNIDLLGDLRSNFFQSLNALFFGLTMAALLSGLAKIPTPVTERPLTLWLFAGFFFLLRLKMFLDDHKYFGNMRTKNVHLELGFLVGAVSWILWGMSAWSIGVLQSAYFFPTWCAIAIIPTIWIIVVALRLGAYREQYIWIVTNVSFVLLLFSTFRTQHATWRLGNLGILRPCTTPGCL